MQIFRNSFSENRTGGTRNRGGFLVFWKNRCYFIVEPEEKGNFMDIRINHYKIRHHEAGPEGTLRLAPLFDFLQDSAAEHAAELGFGMDDLARKGLLWVLSRIRLEIFRMPEIGEEISVLTYPNGTEKLFARRQFTLCDREGKTLVRAGSLWLVLDRKKLRPVRPDGAFDVPFPLNADREVHFPEIGKLAELPASLPVLAEYSVGHSSIDVNGHLNNAFYAAYVADLLGVAAGTFAPPRELQLNFLHACLPGDRLRCRGVETDSGGWNFEGSLPDGNVSFQAAVRLARA